MIVGMWLRQSFASKQFKTEKCRTLPSAMNLILLDKETASACWNAEDPRATHVRDILRLESGESFFELLANRISFEAGVHFHIIPGNSITFGYIPNDFDLMCQTKR